MVRGVARGVVYQLGHGHVGVVIMVPDTISKKLISMYPAPRMLTAG